MLVSEFDYHLPPELIAQRPLQDRDASRMMVVDRTAGTFADSAFRELPQVLQPGDLLVLNNTRVFPARLLGHRKGLKAQAVGKHNPARRQFLPPYIRRSDNPSDREAYQTIYAKARGAVAAPTAGLHFTPAVFEALRARGVEICEVTLHVGLATFRPVEAECVEDHKMEAEHFEIAPPAAAAIDLARREGRRIVAVGTTSVRTLEHVARRHDGKIVAANGEADLFIVPGFQFQITGGLLTNFHLPRSTLLMLVSAFAGRDLILRAYQHAIERGYRFYSYGDCML